MAQSSKLKASGGSRLAVGGLRLKGRMLRLIAQKLLKMQASNL